MKPSLLGIVAGALAAGGVVFAQPIAVGGYLTEGGLPDTALIVPAPPVKGSPLAASDRAIFRATRSLKDTPRWAMAIGDVEQPVAVMYRDWSCALGVTLTPETAPKATALFRKMFPDIVAATNRPKYLYHRQRPFLVDAGTTCQPQTPALQASPDFPSGHAAWGWSFGMVMAELAPDRAAQSLARGRAFGESRVVCGVHNASSVEAGRLNGASVVAALNGTPAFRSDLDAARLELATLRTSAPAPDAKICAAEAEMTATRPW